jgi:hypothetical protein
VDVSGIWHGEYRYEPAGENSPVTFTLRLTQDSAGVVVGTVVDGPGGMPDEGRIIGESRRGRLSFLKRMPVAHVLSPDTGTSVEVGVYLASHGYEPAGPVEHELLYQGRLSNDGRTLAGEWRLEGVVVPLKENFPLYLGGGRGTWTATRADG